MYKYSVVAVPCKLPWIDIHYPATVYTSSPEAVFTHSNGRENDGQMVQTPYVTDSKLNEIKCQLMQMRFSQRTKDLYDILYDQMIKRPYS
jgi:hypothetical protein